MIHREECGDCHHGAHPDGPCLTVTVSGPPTSDPPTPTDPHPGRNVDPCTCLKSTPYRNGHEVV